jgi:putative hydrolase of HD superfamily
MTIQNLIAFSSFLHEFRKVERRIHVKGQERYENDTEHSYMLAMLAWYVCSVEKLDLDIKKVLAYALAHDVVEVYAGDTFLYSDDKQLHESKHQREHDAHLRIQKEFPEFKELHEAIEHFEKLEDPESRFVYTLDKIQPCLMVYLDGGHDWKKDQITLDMVKTSKKEKMKDPRLQKYWNDLLKIFEKEEKNLFPGV